MGGGLRGLALTGLIWDTWKVGWIVILLGRLSLTADILTILSVVNGPINRSASLQDSTCRGAFLVDNQTDWGILRGGTAALIGREFG